MRDWDTMNSELLKQFPAARGPEKLPDRPFRHELPRPPAHTHQIAAMQSGSSPKIPALGVSGDVTELNVDIGGRLLRPTFPTRNRHRGGIKLFTQLSLAYAHAAAKSNDPGCPLAISCVPCFTHEALLHS